MKPISIGEYSPKIKSKFEGLKPGTRIPSAISAPAKINVKKFAGKVPTKLLRKYRQIPEMRKVVRNQITSVRSRSDSLIDSFNKLGIVPIIAPANPHKTMIL